MASVRFTSAIRTIVRGAHAPAAPAAAAAPSAEVQALRVKEAGAWKNLSVEEKRQIYRATYGQSRVELMHSTSDTAKIVVAVVIASALSVLISKALQSFGQPAPKTLSPEWKAAEAKQLKERGINPISGISSK